MKALALLLLAQVQFMQNGTTVNSQTFRINCGANVTCSPSDRKTVTMTAMGYDGGKVAEAYMADASVTSQRLETDPAGCSAGQYVTDINAYGVPTCSTPPKTVWVRATENTSSTSTSFANVTGLSFSVLKDTSYTLECDLLYTTAVTTTALQVTLAGPTMVSIGFDVATQTSSTSSRFAGQTALGANTNPGTGGGATVLGVRLTGSFRVSTSDGTLTVQFASEVGGSTVTVLANSWCALGVV